MPRNISIRRKPFEPVTPQALSQLENLIGSRVLDLDAIAGVVKSDSALLARMARVLHQTDDTASAFPTVEECILELGAEGMRRCLRDLSQN
jgi:hypothetical protein